MSDENGTRANLGAVAATLDGLRALTKQGFADTQRQLDELKPLPGAIHSLSERQLLSEQRLKDLEQWKDQKEKDDAAKRGSFRDTFPLVLVGLLGTLATLVAAHVI